MFAGVLTLLCAVTLVAAIPRELLYQHGEGIDSTLPREMDEVSSPEITLLVPIVFYGEVYSTIYVNSNGLLSFLTEIPSFFNVQFPLDYPVIAPLYTNVDTRGSGDVYYRETQDPSLLERATETIRVSFSSGADFTPKSLFIATWEDVGYHDQGSDKVNTFQVVIASDETDSYVQLLYADGGIQWIQGTGQASGLPDARAQAGLVSGDGRLFTLRGSGTDQIQNLDKWSNINVPGMWAFHVGQVGDGGNVMPPDLEVHGLSPSTATCVQGATACHSKATCVDHVNAGFCCVCQDGYYGNGINCLKNDIPLRVNGRISGHLNGQNLSQLDLQSYVVTADGRTYTAISRVTEKIGRNLQVLNVLGGVIGWLFARSLNGAPNGYQLTGGVFNHTVDISLPDTEGSVKIQQQYLGLDVFDQLKMEAEIRGELPAVPEGNKVQLEDYEEQYTRIKPGFIVSTSSQKYLFNGVPVNGPYHVEQTLEYLECPHGDNNISTLRLKVARNFISHEVRENIVRYGMTNKISPPGDTDPCRDVISKCGGHSTCIAEYGTYRCVCNPGFQRLFDESHGGDSGTCVDVNECSTGTHNCDQNARCYNDIGSFSCQCRVGYTGDGRSCEKLITCEDLHCHENSECLQVAPGNLRCQCLPGFTGDDDECWPIMHRPCNIENTCSQFGTCTTDAAGDHVCVCLPGYHGDGHACYNSALSGNVTDGEPPAPSCVLGVCWCPAEYNYERQICVRIRDEETTKPEEEDSFDGYQHPLPTCHNSTSCTCPYTFNYNSNTGICEATVPLFAKDVPRSTLSCNVFNNCHPHAQCIFSSWGQYQCQCNAGYEGDGYECYEIDVSCLEVDLCDRHAACVYNDAEDKALCMCNPGYTGDGVFCSQIDECVSLHDCGGNANCEWSVDLKRYVCICFEGFVKEESRCVPLQGSGCDVLNDCDANARCLQDPETNEHRCVCNAGYAGDGRSCSVDLVGCNILHNCGHGADCVLDNRAAGYRCRCRQGFHGDGYVCAPDYSCLQDPNLCGVHASCVPGRSGYHVCQCDEGFTGNGVLCKVASKYEGNFLLLNQGMSTLRIPFKPTNKDPGYPITIQYFQMAIGIDVDCLGGRVYWSDITGRSIRSSSYDGSNVTKFLMLDGGSPEGVSIDWVSRNIYWTDSNKDTLEVASLDTKLKKVLVSEGLVNPRGIAVHPARGKVFWSDWNRDGPKLEWANLDGTERETFLVGDAVKLPNSLAIDYQRDELCWADAGTKAIECAGISNKIIRSVTVNCSYPFGLTISQDNYYWTDWNTQKVESAQRPSGKLNKAITVPLGGSGKMYGIVAVPENCPRLSNACQFGNGRCGPGHLCLPNSSGGRSCICADSTDEEGSGEASICNDI